MVEEDYTMNPGQKQFHDFALERVQMGKEAELAALMVESFHKQDTGAFTPEYLSEIAPKMMALLRPECIAEFQQAAAHLRGQVEKS